MTRNFLLNKFEDLLTTYITGRTVKAIRKQAKFSHEMTSNQGVLSVSGNDTMPYDTRYGTDTTHTTRSTHPTHHDTALSEPIYPDVVTDQNEILNQYASHVGDAITGLLNNEGISVNFGASDYVISPVTVTFRLALDNIQDYQLLSKKDFQDKSLKPVIGIDNIYMIFSEGRANVVINIPDEFQKVIRISDLEKGCFGETDKNECMTAFLDKEQTGSVHTKVLGMPSCGKTELLKAISYSYMEVMTPDEMRIIVMCTNDKFLNLKGSPYLLCPIPTDDEELQMVVDYTEQLYDHCQYKLSSGLGFKVIVINDEYEDITDDIKQAFDFSERAARRGRNYDFHLLVATQDHKKSQPGNKKFGNIFVGVCDSPSSAYANTKKNKSGAENLGESGDFLNYRKGKWDGKRVKTARVYDEDYLLLDYPPDPEATTEFYEPEGFTFTPKESYDDCDDGIGETDAPVAPNNKTMPDGETIFTIMALDPSYRQAANEYKIKRAAMDANKPIAVRLKELFVKYGIDLDTLLAPQKDNILEDAKNAKLNG